jgi:hypothetical protein
MLKKKRLKSRARSASIDSRLYKCRQPWVLKGKSDQNIQIYENTWKELVDELGYPSRKLHNYTRSKIRRVPPSFEVSERKKQKLITPPSNQGVKASNLSCSTPMLFLGSSSWEASSPSRSPSIEVITTTCEGTAYSTPSTLSDLTQSEAPPQMNRRQAICCRTY